MWNSISYVSILQLYKGVSLNNVSSYFPGKFLWGKRKFVMVVEISNVLPALLTIKVDIALSKRYSRQPQASNRKLMTRLCMWHCSCANFFRGKKSCQILSSFDLCMLEMFMLWIFTITMLLYTQTLPIININIILFGASKNISKLWELPKTLLIVWYR